MHNNIVPHNFDFSMNTVRADGLVNATALTAAYRNTTGIRKDIKDWLRLVDTQSYIAYKAGATGIPVADLVIAENGVGTWLHPDLAEILAMWISYEYRDAVVALIRQAKEQPIQPALPKISGIDHSVHVAQGIRTITDTLSDNPRLAQFLIDQAIDKEFSQAQLPGDSTPIKGAAEIAEQLGLPVNAKNRTALGKWMVKQDHEILKEERLCNGQMRAINCYRQTPEVEASIRAFFS